MNRLQYNFAERMNEGRALALIARNKGQAGSPFGKRNVKNRHRDVDPNSWSWLVESARRAWRDDCSQAKNDFAVACLNGTAYGDHDALAF